MYTLVSAVMLLMIYGVEGLTLIQNEKIWLKSVVKSVTFKCEVTGLGDGNYVHWYHKKDGGTFKRILYLSYSGSLVSEAKGFEAWKRGNSYEIKIKEVKKEHAGVYYCACWVGGNWIKRFGSGTRLIVTDANKDKPVTPNVAIYSSIKNDKPVEKNTILCQASGMFPDLVKFSWETKSSSGKWTVLDMKGENVEQRDEIKNEVFVTNLLIVDKDTAKNNNYRCIVEHEGNKEPTKHLSGPLKPEKAESSVKKPDDDTLDPTCPPSEIIKQDSGKPLDQTPSMYLFVYVYGMMIMKCGVYFAAVCLFLFKSKAGKKEDKSLKPNTGIK